MVRRTSALPRKEAPGRAYTLVALACLGDGECGLKRKIRMGPSTRTTLAIGGSKEEQARRYLEARGLRLVCRNYRCRSGEIDLIMRDGACLAFVEVRYRKGDRFGTPAETVTQGKQRRIIKAARHYLQRHPGVTDCRFDVVAITGEARPEWLRDAFQDS